MSHDRNAFLDTSISHAPPVILLTGGIATGKTFVSEYLGSLGANIVDTDLLAREVVSPGSERGRKTLALLAEKLGAEILTSDGNLDRAYLRKRIFSDVNAKKILESILHPQILSLTKERIAEPVSTYHLMVVPLLHKGSPYLNLADFTIGVEVFEAEQKKRLMARDGITEALADEMMASQISRLERRKLVDVIIINHDRGGVVRKLDQLHARIIHHTLGGGR
ncbi:dephospho-CoA kinase [Ignatzschineria sp. RMDPL8A]|uniref:dephospho-CoA kinase n=1 Tax=Ignatzschineria sp. RMDPL8A TaxID=2999236 RepID=UPI0024466F69|nr:dephospho-CoA kinase [Ignatzschineria sp. RMDPL8A]MDG9729894.1 dephospho-CoA kinase [Ignatzschineria sp. RMDPL8A]